MVLAKEWGMKNRLYRKAIRWQEKRTYKLRCISYILSKLDGSALVKDLTALNFNWKGQNQNKG